MKSFIVLVLAIVASASATVFTTGFGGFSGYPVSTVSYNPGFGYNTFGSTFAPVSTTFGTGFSRPIYTTGLGSFGGFNSGFGFGYRPAFNTFNTGFSSYPYTSTFFKK